MPLSSCNTPGVAVELPISSNEPGDVVPIPTRPPEIVGVVVSQMMYQPSLVHNCPLVGRPLVEAMRPQATTCAPAGAVIRITQQKTARLTHLPYRRMMLRRRWTRRALAF